MDVETEIQRGSPEIKFGRAEEHLEALKDLIDAFTERKPYRLALQAHRLQATIPSDFPQFEVVVRDLRPVPDEIGSPPR